MFKAVFAIITLVFGMFVVSAQEATLINVKGKVLSAEDSSTVISTSILYEKLPYYDDMGLTSANAEGYFSFHLVKGGKYNISIAEDNYKKYDNQITVEDGDGNEIHEMNFYLEKIEQQNVFTLEDVNFARGSEKLQPESYKSLDRLVNEMRDNRNMVIQLEGHTDFAGNPQANMALSQARVESVKDYLRKNGISKKRIKTKAYGGSRPLFRERTREAMASNRRVEVRVLKR